MPAKSTLLDRYHAKRNFSKTAEPEGKVLSGENHFRYVIQKHAARRLHYDFRLELDGVLKSWAITRGPSLDPKEKRLAVEVEDHPIDYGTFEGTIPQGEYGGGTVMLWDIGTWEPIGDPKKQLASGKLHFRLHGERLKGEWNLVRIRGRKDEKRTNWLLMKKDDCEAVSGNDRGILDRFDTSIISKRAMDAIAAAKDAVWSSKKKTEEKAKPSKKLPAKAKILSKSSKQNSHKKSTFIPPQLATLVTAMPEGDKWVHEIKFDGYRTQVHIENGKAKLITRSGLNWTYKFPTLAVKLAELPVETAIIDGEVIAVDAQGVSSFKALQNALTDENDCELQYYAFDLLYLNGERLTNEPLTSRKSLLAELLEQAPERVFYSEHFTSQKGTFFNKACALNLEGIISKHVDAPYEEGRSKSWLKSKCVKRQEFVIGGFTLPSKGKGIGALILGYYEGGSLHYAGRVGTGFTGELSLSLRNKLEKLRTTKPAFSEQLPGEARRGVQYVKPELVCEVQYAEWTESGVLRHPSFQGLREDKPAEDVGRDKAAPIKAVAKKTETKSIIKANPTLRAMHVTGDVFAGVKISSTDKLLFPEDDITKGMLAEYYASIADEILAHIADRPLSIVRCTGGIAKACFFQRHNTLKGVNIHDVHLPDKPKELPYLMVKDAKGLLSLVQLGVIEMHMWNSHAKKILFPDQMVFDLDPDPAIGWNEVVTAALEVRGFMEAIGLKSFVKTTGGKGLHVVIPLTPKHGWDIIKPFTKSVAETLQANAPHKYVANMSKAKRKSKIFVDYLRNDETATAVAPFSARARPGATVAIPISWDELPDINPAAFNVRTIPDRLKRLKTDPWEGFAQIRQTIPTKYQNNIK